MFSDGEMLLILLWFFSVVALFLFMWIYVEIRKGRELPEDLKKRIQDEIQADTKREMEKQRARMTVVK